MADFKRIIQRTTNSERVETGVADLQPNEICIVEDGEELIYKDRNGNIISVSKDKYKVGTIEDLKKSKKYKVGDVVEVLGYYSAGDGAGHPRQKKPSGYTGADAVIGADGSIWGVVHSGKVNVSWFGAKGDGINDDAAFLKMSHNYAFILGLRVVYQKAGVYLIDCSKSSNLGISLGYYVDFNFSTLKFKIPNWNFPPVFITQDEEYSSLTFEGSKITKGTTIQSNFNKLKLSFLKLSGEVNSIKSTPYQLEEPLATTSGGCLIGRPVVERDMTKNIVEYRELTNPTIFKNLTIFEEYEGGQLDIVEKHNYRLFHIKDRDFITFENIKFDNNEFVASRSGFYIERCFSVTIENVINSGFAKVGEQQGVNSAWGYPFNLYFCVDVKVKNFKNHHSNEHDWGSTIGMNNCKLISCDDCNLYAPDQHSLIQDLKITNSTISRSSISGDGYRIYDNVTFIKSHPSPNEYLFSFRGESLTNNNNSFEGEIIVKNSRLLIESYLKFRHFKLINFDGATKLENSISDKFFDKFTLDNFEIEVVGGGIPTFSFFTFAQTEKRYFKNFTVKNCDFSKVSLMQSGKTNYDFVLKHQITPARNVNGYPIKPSMYIEFDNVVFSEDIFESAEKRKGFSYFQYNDSLSFNTEVPKITYRNCKNVAFLFGGSGIVNINNCNVKNLYLGGGTQPSRKAKVILNNSFASDWSSIDIPSQIAIDSTSFYIEKNTKIENVTGLYLQTVDLSSYHSDLKQRQTFFRDNYGEKLGFIVDVISNQLNTPYYTSKMEEQGILGKYYAYLDELHEYEKQSNSEIMTLEIRQAPILPKVIEDFAKEYNLI